MCIVMRNLTLEQSPLHRVSSKKGEPSSKPNEISGNLGGSGPNPQWRAEGASRRRQWEEAAGSRSFFAWCPDPAESGAHELGQAIREASGQTPYRTDTEGVADCVPNVATMISPVPYALPQCGRATLPSRGGVQVPSPRISAGS